MSEPDQSYEERIALLERRLSRSQRALNEAETALESRMRELAQANSSLMQREEELADRLELESRQLISAQNVGGFATIVGRPGQPFQASPQLNKILGYPADQQLTIEHLNARVSPLDRKRIAGEAVAFYTTLKSDRDHEFVHRIVHPEKGVRWLQWYIRRISGNDDGKRSILGSVRDITEIRHNERQVKALQLRAERRVQELGRLTVELEDERARTEAALEVRTRFLSTMAHQFRTPLLTLSGVIEMYSEQADDEEMKEQLALAERSAERIGALLDEALAEADGSSNSVSLFTAPVSLDAFLKTSKEFWNSALINEKDGSLSLSIGQGFPAKVEADAVRLRELFDDLVGFGLEACGAIEVNASWERGLKLVMRPAEDVCADTAPENMVSDPQMRRVDQLANAMGGTLNFDEAQGCMIVELPLTPLERDAAEAEQPLATADGDQPQVLLAEDTESNRAIITAMLEKLGCRVETAVNGAEALDAATSRRFDAVLMDVMMPVMDGEEAVRRIRASEEPYSRTPVIGITAHTLHEERERLLAAGMSACLSKPVKRMELRSSLKTAFGVAASNSGRLDHFNLDQFASAFEAVPSHYRARFLEAVETDLNNYGEKLVASLTERNYEEADKNAHALKGVAGNLGANRMLDEIARLREQIESGSEIDPAAVRQMLQETGQECRDLFEVRYGGD